MNPPNVLGFDPSLVSSGYAYSTPDGTILSGRVRPKKLRGEARLDFISAQFEQLIDNLFLHYRSPPLIVYEGYAMGMRGTPGRFFDIGELGGVLKLIAYRKYLRVLLVPPANLKKFATGKGNADKETIASVLADSRGLSFANDDEMDAFILMEMGQAYLEPRRARASYRKEALSTCKLIANNA